ncbi:MAG TPA: DUF4397 domain-containing protein [Hanamia sp.]
MSNKIFHIIRSKFFYIFLFSAIIFSACKKDDTPATPTSGLMAFNLIPDSTGPVIFALDNSALANTAFSFTNYTGAYLPIYSGTRNLQTYESPNTSTALAATTFNYEAKKYYSAFAIGAHGNYQNLVTNDELDSLPSSTGNAFVRYINAIPDSSHPVVTISANGTDKVKENASFGSVSDFTQLAPGDITFNVSNDSTISASRTFTVQQNGIYTVLIMGLPGAADTSKAVQIKYIVNGTITP